MGDPVPGEQDRDAAADFGRSPPAGAPGQEGESRDRLVGGTDAPGDAAERPAGEDPAAAEEVVVVGDGTPPATRRRARRRDSLLEIAVVVLLALFLALLLKVHVAEAYQIKGQSMQPTFLDGQRVMVQKMLYDLDRGDIIIFASKTDPDKDLIKRVIGLPGDTVFVLGDGEVLVNGKKLDEDYIRLARSPRMDAGPFHVPPHTVFVLGDNRPQSQDSRVFGYVRDESIKGKVLVRWWPVSEFRSF